MQRRIYCSSGPNVVKQTQIGFNGGKRVKWGYTGLNGFKRIDFEIELSACG